MAILDNVMLPYARSNMSRSWIFQQESDPKHDSHAVHDWFGRRRVTNMVWPSQSPDLNPIKHLWEELGRMLKGKTAKNANEKFAQLEQAWRSIPVTTLTNLLASMPRRCQAVIDAKGMATKY